MNPFGRPRLGSRLVPLVVALALAGGWLFVRQPLPVAAETVPETPVVEATPYCFPYDGQWTITVTGHSFSANTSVVVSDWIYYQKPDDSKTVTTDEYGTFTTQLTITTNNYYYSNNIRTVYSGDSTSTTVAQTWLSLCSGGPLFAQLDPPCSDDSIPTIHVVGSGWAAAPSDAVIQFKVLGPYPGPQYGDTHAIPAQASFDESWSLGVPLPAGEYDVQISQNGGDGEVNNGMTLGFVTPCPTATVTPNCGTAGSPPNRMTLSISGSGFETENQDGYADLEIVFDPDGKPQTFFYEAPGYLGPGGTFGPLEIQPYARPNGTYTVEIRQSFNSGGSSDRDYKTTIRVPCKAPAISLTPDCGDYTYPGQVLDVTLNGKNFVPNVSATFVMDVDGIFETEPSVVAVNSQGVIDNAHFKAEDRPDAVYKAMAYQDVNGVHFEANTTWRVPCLGPPISPPPTATPTPTVTPGPTLTPPPAPFLTMSPTCMPELDGQAGAYSLSLTGGGFLPGNVTVVLDPSGAPFSGTLVADATGLVSATVVTDGKPAGSYPLIAYQDNNGVHIEASATLTVPCATVTLSPPCVAPAAGKPAAYQVTASGVGFGPDPVDLVFDPTGVAPVTTQALPDAFGSFTAPMTFDGKPPGIYDLVASQTSSYGLLNQSIAQLLVPCDQAVIRITPSTGPRGFVPVVEGFGFKPLTNLILQWDFGIGARQPTTVVTDEFGYFRSELVVFQHDFLGLRHVTVTDPTNPEAYTDLLQPYLVAAAAIQPPFSADEPSAGSQPDPVILQR